MGAYMHGNLAVDDRHEHHYRENVRVRETRRVVLHKHSVPAREKLLYLFTIILCVVVAGTVIFRYAQIYDVNTRIQHIEKEIERLELENKALILSVRKLQEPNKLYEIGVELGFVQPSDEAIGQVSQQSKPLTREDLDIAFRE